MPQGDKSSYTSKQRRKADHIAEGYEKRGTSTKEAEARAWATVNKESGGGKKSGSGRGKPESRVSSKKGGRKGAASQSTATRKRAGKKAAATRKRSTTKRTTAKRSTRKSSSRKSSSRSR
jgi:plasmid stabilization system protein ParE